MGQKGRVRQDTEAAQCFLVQGRAHLGLGDLRALLAVRAAAELVQHRGREGLWARLLVRGRKARGEQAPEGGGHAEEGDHPGWGIWKLRSLRCVNRPVVSRAERWFAREALAPWRANADAAVTALADHAARTGLMRARRGATSFPCCNFDRSR